MIIKTISYLVYDVSLFLSLMTLAYFGQDYTSVVSDLIVLAVEVTKYT